MGGHGHRLGPDPRRTHNIDIRFAAAIALLFNVPMVFLAIIAIALTVPRDNLSVGR
jgi:hypothetical protein